MSAGGSSDGSGIGGDGTTITSYNDSGSTSVDSVGRFPGFTFSFKVDVSESQMTFTSRTEGALGISLSDLAGLGDGATAYTLVTPELSRLQDVARAIEGKSSYPGLSIRSEIQKVIQKTSEFEYGGKYLQKLRNLSSIKMYTRAELRTPIGSFGTTGNDPEEQKVSVNIQRIPVPNIQPVVNTIQDMDPIVIEGKLKPASFVANNLAELSGFTAKVNLEIPPEVFVNYVELDANIGGLVNCIGIASNGDEIERTLDDVERRVDSIVSRSDKIADRFQEELRREREQVVKEVVEDIRSEVGGIADSAQGVGDDTKQSVEDVKDDLPTKSEIRETIENGEDPSDLVPNAPSKTTIKSRLSRGDSVERIYAESIEAARDEATPLRDAVNENIPSEILQGIDPSIGNLRPYKVEGGLLPKDIVDDDYLLEEVVCQSTPVSDLDRDEVMDFGEPGNEKYMDKIKSRLFNVFTSDLGSFEAVADELDELEGMVNDAYDVGEECLLLFKDLIGDLRGCSSGKLVADGGRSRSLSAAFKRVMGVGQSIEKDPEGGGTGTGGGTRSREPDCSDVPSYIRAETNDLEERALKFEGSDAVGSQYSEVRSLIESTRRLKSNVRSNVNSANLCKNNIESRLNNLLSLLQGIEKIDCSVVPDRITGGVDDIKSRAKTLSNTSSVEFDYSEVEEIKNKADSLSEEIESEVDDRNPCKDKLKGDLREVYGSIEGIKDVSSEDLPCVSRFADVEDRVDQFEALAQEPSQTIIDLGSGNADIEELRKEIGGDDIDLEDLVEQKGSREIEVRTADIVEYVEENAEGDCIQFFLNRIRTAENELEGAANSLRINDDLFNAASERRGEILDEVRKGSGDPDEVRKSFEEYLDDARS